MSDEMHADFGDDIAWRTSSGYLGSWTAHWGDVTDVVVAATETDARRLLTNRYPTIPADIPLRYIGLGRPHIHHV